MDKQEFKFEPVWITILSAFAIFVIYKLITLVFFSGMPVKAIAIIPLAVAAFCCLFFIFTFKMLAGVPAIVITQERLIDNVYGVSFDWSNVKYISIDGERKPFLSIRLKNEALFYSGISNPIKRALIRALFSIAPGDASVNLALIAGDNQYILGMAQAYWAKYYGEEA